MTTSTKLWLFTLLCLILSGGNGIYQFNRLQAENTNLKATLAQGHYVSPRTIQISEFELLKLRVKELEASVLIIKEQLRPTTIIHPYNPYRKNNNQPPQPQEPAPAKPHQQQLPEQELPEQKLIDRWTGTPNHPPEITDPPIQPALESDSPDSQPSHKSNLTIDESYEIGRYQIIPSLSTIPNRTTFDFMLDTATGTVYQQAPPHQLPIDYKGFSPQQVYQEVPGGWMIYLQSPKIQLFKKLNGPKISR